MDAWLFELTFDYEDGTEPNTETLGIFNDLGQALRTAQTFCKGDCEIVLDGRRYIYRISGVRGVCKILVTLTGFNFNEIVG